jgi:hypothetical protein
MISEAYVQNIFDKSYMETLEAPGTIILIIEMPNKFIFSVSSSTKEKAVELAKHKIAELETYLEVDKKHYGYDFEGEYE